MKSPVQLFVAIAVLLATATVAAQVYKWVDKDGQTQYSDSPPPPGAAKAEQKKIANAPTTAPTPAVAGKPGDTAKATKDKDKDKAKPTAKEIAKETEKQRAEAAIKAKNDEELARVAKVNEDRCKGATLALREFESGRPISRADANGDRSFLSDEERAAEAARMRAAMAESCK